MSTIKFTYMNTNTIIQADFMEKMKDIIKKFCIKTENNLDNIYFLYNGNKINEDLTFEELANDVDKKRKEINVIVIGDEPGPNPSLLKKANYIICPECQESARIDIKDYKISLYDCRNKHKIDNILFNEFEETQYIDESKIVCEICKKANKGASFEHKFFFCFSCKFALCPICRSIHDKSHIVIDYDLMPYICNEHGEFFTLYCSVCKKDLCFMCEKSHAGHKLITFGTIMPEVDDYNKELNNLKQNMDEFKNDINKIIEKLNDLKKQLDIYYKISEDFIKNFKYKKRNYPILQNINDMKAFNKNFMDNISKIISENDIVNKFTSIMEMFEKITYKEKDENDSKNTKKQEKDSGYDGKIIEISSLFGEDNQTNEVKIKETEDNDSKDEEVVEKFNESDNTYENIDISSLEEKKQYETKFKIQKLLVLHDSRILTVQKYYDENGDYKNRIYINNPKKDFKCELVIECSKIYSIFQTDDDNIILKEDNKTIKIIKIKKNSVIGIQQLKSTYNFVMYNISNKIFITNSGENFTFYSYENGKLVEKQNKRIVDDMYDLCEIDERKIAIYYYKSGRVYGYNAFLLFYDIYYYSEDKTLKLGDGETGGKIGLINKNFLILERNEKLVLVDIKNKEIKKEIKFDYSIQSIISLNEKVFLIQTGSYILQYYIDYSKNIKLKEKKKIYSDI